MKFVAPIALALAATSVDALSLRKVETAVATVSKPAVSKHLANKHAVSKHLQLKKKKELSRFAPQYSLEDKWIDAGLLAVSIAAFLAHPLIESSPAAFHNSIDDGYWPRVITTPIDEILSSVFGPSGLSMITVIGIVTYAGLAATDIGHFFIEDGGKKKGGSLNSFYANNKAPMRLFLFFFTWMHVFGNLIDTDLNTGLGGLSKPWPFVFEFKHDIKSQR